jgi:predicted transcriptional regulator
MRRSKLEVHVDILEVLVHWGPLKLTHVMYKVNVNCSVLEGYFELLIRRGLVEVKSVGKGHRVYVITQRGVSVLKQFRELREVLPIVEDTADKVRHQKPCLF